MSESGEEAGPSPAGLEVDRCQTPEGGDIVIIPVDNTPHTEQAFSCKYNTLLEVNVAEQ